MSTFKKDFISTRERIEFANQYFTSAKKLYGTKDVENSLKPRDEIEGFIARTQYTLKQ